MILLFGSEEVKILRSSEIARYQPAELETYPCLRTVLHFNSQGDHLSVQERLKW